MIIAMLLAVAVAGQVAEAPAPTAPKPTLQPMASKVPVRVTIGYRDPRYPAAAASHAECFSTLDGMQAWTDAYAGIRDGALISLPDGYIVRAGTAAQVNEQYVVSSIASGKPSRVLAVKVRILDGEFKGKTLFTSFGNTFRSTRDADIDKIAERMKALQPKADPNVRKGSHGPEQ